MTPLSVRSICLSMLEHPMRTRVETDDRKTAKVLDLIDFVCERMIVTALDVAREFKLTLDEASLLLGSLPFDTGEGVGTYSVDGPSDKLECLVDCDQLIDDRLATLVDTVDREFQRRVISGLVDIHEMLARVEQRVEDMTGGKTTSGSRRRRRGELLEPRPDDTDDLRTMRRQAEVEIKQASATGDRKLYQTTYQRWYQRIKAAEKKAKVGVASEISEPEQTPSEAVA